MHYISTRRSPGTLTLFIIDEFNALRMGEMASILFEQCRDFGGCLMLSSQSYDGLGPREYANRIVDACSTHIIHASSNPFEITKRAGKRWYVDTSYTEDEEGNVRKHTKLRYDWRITEQEVINRVRGKPSGSIVVMSSKSRLPRSRSPRSKSTMHGVTSEASKRYSVRSLRRRHATNRVKR